MTLLRKEKNCLFLLLVDSNIIIIIFKRNSITLTKLASDIVYNTGFFTKSKMFVEAEVLHIDESILWESNEQELRKFVEEECKLKLHVIKLEEFFSSVD